MQISQNVAVSYTINNSYFNMKLLHQPDMRGKISWENIYK